MWIGNVPRDSKAFDLALQRPRASKVLFGYRFDRFPPKLRFTLGVSYHMIVSFVVSSPARLPNGKAGIMDIDLSHREPISSRNWAAYSVAVDGVLATFQKPELTAC
jgi:hypothetical protein